MLSHVDKKNQPTMVDVGDKVTTFRVACARSVVEAPKEVLDLLDNGEITSKKGPVFSTAIVAGTMAVKRTSELIPFCHPLPIESCKFDISVNERRQIIIECRVSLHHKTGVEMEALTGASVAALTIYDMCKAISHEIRIVETLLVEKRGGKSDFKRS